MSWGATTERHAKRRRPSPATSRPPRVRHMHSSLVRAPRFFSLLCARRVQARVCTRVVLNGRLATLPLLPCLQIKSRVNKIQRTVIGTRRGGGQRPVPRQEREATEESPATPESSIGMTMHRNPFGWAHHQLPTGISCITNVGVRGTARAKAFNAS